MASSTFTPTTKHRKKISIHSPDQARKSARRHSWSPLDLAPAQASILHRTSQDDSIALVVRNYVPQDTITATSNERICTKQPRICGAWVEVLPSLRNGGGTPNLVLSAAIEALATSITTQKLHPNSNNVESFRSYETALRSLRKSVVVDGRSDAELLASIMCLSLVEVRRTLLTLLYLVTHQYL